MFSQKQIAAVLSEIERTSNLTHCQDDDDFEKGQFYCPDHNGNFDDAFQDGCAAGEINFARKLLNLLTTDAE